MVLQQLGMFGQQVQSIDIGDQPKLIGLGVQGNGQEATLSNNRSPVHWHI